MEFKLCKIKEVKHLVVDCTNGLLHRKVCSWTKLLKEAKIALVVQEDNLGNPDAYEPHTPIFRMKASDL